MKEANNDFSPALASSSGARGSALEGLPLDMTTRDETRRGAGSIHTDQIGKVFRAIITQGVSLRECLACGELFTREASREHAMVLCMPGTRKN
jgi:hypothetical protein